MSRFHRPLSKGMGAALCALVPNLALAADHIDAPAVVADPAADLTDLYAWSDGGSMLNLALDVPSSGPGSSFSDAVQYVFHIETMSAFGESGTRTDLICTFDAAQMVSCWVGEAAYLKGDASGSEGLRSEDGMVRVFTGRRNDPFFFNLSGFQATIATVVGAASGLDFDPAGCPALDQATSTALVTQLASEPDGSPAADDFAGGEVLSLVVQVDTSLLGTGPIAAVWASTRR